MDDRALDVVVRSEAKLARNVEGYPYPGSIDAAQEAEILERALAVAGSRYALLPLQALPPMRRAKCSLTTKEPNTCCSACCANPWRPCSRCWAR